MTSPEESSSTETRNSDSVEVNTNPLAVCLQFGTKIDFAVGQVYYDFSGEETKYWLEVEKPGDDISNVIPGGGVLVKPRVSNRFGTPLLFLGWKNGKHFITETSQRPVNYLYFLSEDKIVGVVAKLLPMMFITHVQLWPHDETLVHKNVYYYNKKNP